jgi:uncharacterized SAM-binding protein YcdF (DUF218 family)
MSVRTEPPTVELPQAPRRRAVRRAAVALGAVVLAVAALLPLAALGRVLMASGATDAGRTDVIVVLGASQYWGRPSPVLEARLDHARAVLGDGVAPRVVTVGGKRPGDRTTEAQAGRDWLVAHGVPASSVQALPEGSDTMASLAAVASLMSRNGWTSATLVTDPAHMARSLAMAQALGIHASASPTTSGSGSALTPDYVARETAGLLYFWLVERRAVTQVVAN